jgi:alkanesulfonate monooxygenase SsuD/methylene tetrahydromethanopterin reductase-like flavin-dependent oxidoreductase (luciferase family)
VALDGAGWHPAAWREPGARPGALFTAGYWADLAREAEASTLDFLTIEDSLGIQTAGRFAAPDMVPYLIPAGLDEFAATVVPLLQERGVFRSSYEAGTTLRDRLGLGPARPAASWAAARTAGREHVHA